MVARTLLAGLFSLLMFSSGKSHDEAPSNYEKFQNAVSSALLIGPKWEDRLSKLDNYSRWNYKYMHFGSEGFIAMATRGIEDITFLRQVRQKQVGNNIIRTWNISEQNHVEAQVYIPKPMSSVQSLTFQIVGVKDSPISLLSLGWRQTWGSRSDVIIASVQKSGSAKNESEAAHVFVCERPPGTDEDPKTLNVFAEVESNRLTLRVQGKSVFNKEELRDWEDKSIYMRSGISIHRVTNPNAEARVLFQTLKWSTV